MTPSTPARSSVQSTGYLILVAIAAVLMAMLFLIGYLASVVFSLLGLSLSDVIWYFDWLQAG